MRSVFCGGHRSMLLEDKSSGFGIRQTGLEAQLYCVFAL